MSAKPMVLTESLPAVDQRMQRIPRLGVRTSTAITERPAASGNVPDSPLCWKPIARRVRKSNGEAVVPSGQAPTTGCGALEQGNALFIVCHDCLVPQLQELLIGHALLCGGKSQVGLAYRAS